MYINDDTLLARQFLHAICAHRGKIILAREHDQTTELHAAFAGLLDFYLTTGCETVLSDDKLPSWTAELPVNNASSNGFHYGWRERARQHKRRVLFRCKLLHCAEAIGDPRPSKPSIVKTGNKGPATTIARFYATSSALPWNTSERRSKPELCCNRDCNGPRGLLVVNITPGRQTVRAFLPRIRPENKPQIVVTANSWSDRRVQFYFFIAFSYALAILVGKCQVARVGSAIRSDNNH